MLNTMWTVEDVNVKQEPDLQPLIPVSCLPPLPTFQQDYPTITISELTSPDSSCYSITNINTSLEQSSKLVPPFQCSQ